MNQPMTRHLAIGDIHGCFNALRSLIDLVGITSNNTVITLGDYVNRGPNSCAVLDWLIRHPGVGRLIPLRGNHEIMMLNARNDDDSYRKWIAVGGKATLKSYSPFETDDGTLSDVPDAHWDFLENHLVPTFETEHHFFVHANAYPDLPIADQPDFMLYWEQFEDPPMHASGKVMVCGHKSQKSGLPMTNGSAICIDTWAFGRGWLTCLHVESGMLWQANEAGQTRRMFLDELDVE